MALGWDGTYAKKKGMIKATSIRGIRQQSTTPVSVLHANIWNIIVMPAQVAMEMTKRGRDPKIAIPRRPLRKVTSSLPVCTEPES